MSVSPQLRADARRNRDRIVAAAKACFAAEGVECQMAEVARRAGVGNATVFRHFPTKRDLIVAIVEARMAEMLTLADEAVALAEQDPEAGLRLLVDGIAAAFVADHGLKQMAEMHFQGDASLTQARDALLDRLGVVVVRCQAAGIVRADAEPIDFVVLVHAVATAAMGLEEARPGIHKRYLSLALAGLTARAAQIGPPLETGPPTADELEDAMHAPSSRLRC
jgi:AcrR family transcriptional regulator